MKNWEIKSDDLIIRCEQDTEQERKNVATVCIIAAGKYSKAEVSMLALKDQKNIDMVGVMLLKNLIDLS